MSFASLTFAFFLIAVFTVYWLALPVKWHRARLAWLLVCGYAFYGWWDWRFALLLIASTLVTWACALKGPGKRRWAIVSVVFNIGILVVFKYLGFFGEGLQRLLALFGAGLDWFTADVLLPVGISFYTLQAISYSVDVYKGRISPERSLLAYALYIGFFPQLVAGPIERAQDILRQLRQRILWDTNRAIQGMRQLLWGLFKKCVVADGLAYWVINGYDVRLHDTSEGASFECFIAVMAFALQLYGDFSGYSDIARGTARLLGIELMNNFLYPYFSRNAVEFWRRWHRSLMRWFTTYVYIPLGGSRTSRTWVNVMIVFALSGLWHGASLNFMLWGVLCGVWVVTAKLCRCRPHSPVVGGVTAAEGDGRISDDVATRADAMKMAGVFICYSLTLVIFRLTDASEALLMWQRLIWPGAPIMAAILLAAWLVGAKCRLNAKTLLAATAVVYATLLVVWPQATLAKTFGAAPFIAAAVMMAAEWRSRRRSFALEKMPRNPVARYAIYFALYIAIFCFSIDSSVPQFIYFQF